MARAIDLIAYLDGLLEPHKYADYGPNGLQVPGKDEIRTIVSAVTCSLEAVQAARRAGADLVLAHHGLFWGEETELTRVQAGRLRALTDAGVALAAYHLPLDAHPEHGNNALLSEALGAESHAEFAPIGRIASFAGDGITVAELLARTRAATAGRDPLLQGRGPERIRRLAVVSGSGTDYLEAAADAGCDGLLTGEPREQSMSEAAELGLHVVAAGHYATETRGVRRLGELLEREFAVAHTFVDLPNPV